MELYIPRMLHFVDDNGKTRRIDETELATSGKSIIILAEPGMGKTWLLRRLANLPNNVFRSAPSFVAHPRPADLVPAGATLLIDGLDELSATDESDPIYRVLGKLIEAGCPPFILSCRAADWRGAVARQDIADDYGVAPRQMWLEPFTHDHAVDFLSPRLGPVRADEIVTALDERSIPDLYGNPLTLELFAAVAAEDETLPATRSELLHRASELLWREPSDRKRGSPLASLDTGTAIASAGALSAAFVLTGSEAITLNPSSAWSPATLAVAEIGQLPHAARARALLGSRLFAPIPGSDDRFKPIHRTLAEFLGAQWLAAAAPDDLACDRLHAALTVDEGVPASLRGIHAWLARDPRFAPRVIDTDPYGVLRYGDADGLSVDEGRRLLVALTTLQQANPYFRAGDWSTFSAKGLTHIELLDDVRAVILSETTTFHLRTLLLGIMRGSPLAAALTAELEHILKDPDDSFTYAERQEAALALTVLETHKNRLRPIVEQLIADDTEDATRLALDIMQEIDFRDFSASDITTAVLARLGLLSGSSTARSFSMSLYEVARGVPDGVVAGVLDCLASALPSRDATRSSDMRYDLGLLISHLISRQIRLARPEPHDLLSWLRIIAGRDVHRGDDQQHIADFLRGDDDLRHAIQLLILTEQGDGQVWNRIWHLGTINPALTLSIDDVVHHLCHLAGRCSCSDEDIAVWRELAAFSRSSPEATSRIIDAARLFAGNRPELQAYLDALLEPLPVPQAEVDRAARRQAQTAQREADRARDRREFAQHEAELRAGDLRWVLPPAQAYLGLFSDIASQLPPSERIGDWLGPELQNAALNGFEAVLYRPDLPTLEQVCQSYAESRRWHFVHPMIAGVAERIRTGRGVGDLPPDVPSIALVGLLNEQLGDRIADRALIQTLDDASRADPVHFERYVRLLIEPSLSRSVENISGLYAFAHSTLDRDLSLRLAAEWLERYPNLPQRVEAELTDTLLRAGDRSALQRRYPSRLDQSLDNEERTRMWQALALLCDFATVAPRFTPVAVESRNLLWYLRDRLGSERRKSEIGFKISPETLAWIVKQFRPLWPSHPHPTGSTWGNTNPWDATEFIESIIHRLASDTSDSAVGLLRSLADAPPDGYTARLRYAFDQQRHTRREINFAGVSLTRLVDVLQARSPRTTDDILSIVLNTLNRLQAQLRGNDTDTVKKYWRDETPLGEDICTDLLIEDIERLLPRLGIGRIPQRDMPAGKRADIVFTASDAALPVECKGQWDRTLWTAAHTQLDALYLRDWQTQDRGLYIVYWFGSNVPRRRALRSDPARGAPPKTPDELRDRLIEALPPHRRGSISIAILDLSQQ